MSSAIDAYNGGELEVWYGLWQVAEPDALTDSFVLANRQMEIAEPCRDGGTTPSGDTIVECVVTVSDDFYGAAGISGTYPTTFHVNSDDRLTDWSQGR